MRVTEAGQITIPPELREKHGMKPGCEVDLVDGPNPGEVVVRIKAREHAERRTEFRAWLDRIEGIADAGMTTDEILDMTRGRDRRE